MTRRALSKLPFSPKLPGHYYFMSFHYLSKRKLFIFVQLSLFFFHLCGVTGGEAAEDIAWQGIETRYTTIRYQSIEDLKNFNRRMKYNSKHSRLKRLFSSPGSDDLVDRITTKVDVLFQRVQEILDMRKRMDKVTVNIYHDKSQLHDAFFSIYKRPCRIRAWYRYSNNTVYINVKDLHDGMLAHELAHAIIDHYLLVRPPHAAAEILARYVDSHLRR